MKFTVGVAAYNEERSIGRLLDFLVTQNVPEILVYNDGSGDLTGEILKRYERRFPSLHVINGIKNLGYATALNTIIREAENEIVVLLDADSLPEDGAIQKIVEPFKNPNIGATTGTHLIREEKRSIISLVNKRIYEAKKRIDILQTRKGDFMHLNGLLFAVRKSLVKERLKKMTNQDAYLGFLVKSKCSKIEFIPKARSKFQPPQTVRDYINSRRRVIRGHMVLGLQYNIKEYIWHECSLSEYLRMIITAQPIYSIKGLLSFLFGAFIDLFFRLYWYSILHKNSKKFNEYQWEQIRSTKW